MSEPKDLNNPSPWNMRIWDEAKYQWLCDGEDDVLPYYGFDIRGGEVTATQSMDWVYRQFEHGRKFIWERSTGLTDKNGKEIYEGDIVKDGEDGMYNQVVWFSQVGGFRVAPSRKAVEFLKARAPEYLTKGEAVGWFITDDLEVVGNIHENPELLGGEE